MMRCWVVSLCALLAGCYGIATDASEAGQESGGDAFAPGDDASGSSDDDVSGDTDSGGDPTPNEPTDPPVVTPCPDGHGDGSNVGKWVDITPQYMRDNPTYTNALVPIVDPSNPSNVYLMTDGNGVFKSTDCGATWGPGTRINTGLNGDKLNSGRIWAAVIDRYDPQTLYALTGYGAPGLWKTENGGVDWKQTLDEQTIWGTSGFTEMVSIDPDDRKHLIINFHQGTDCLRVRPVPACVAETKDGGETWSLLDIPEELVPITYEGSGVAILSGDIWLHTGVLRTVDGGANWEPVTFNPPLPGNAWAQFVGNGAVFRTPDGTYYLGTSVGVYYSDGPDLGAEWTLIPNSGSNLIPVYGDGERIYAAGLLGSKTTIWTASYADPMTWTQLDNPELDPPAISGTSPWTMDADPEHHLLYLTLGGGGLWRMETE